MKCFLFIPESDLDDRISNLICRTLRDCSRAKVCFFHPQTMGPYQKPSLPEIKSDVPHSYFLKYFTRISTWYQVVRALKRRRHFREMVIIVGSKPRLLFWVYLLTGKKPIFIWITTCLKSTLSWLDGLILRYFSQSLLTNDQQLNQHLRQKNQPSYFIGNILADLVQPVEFFFSHGSKPIYSFFPTLNHLEADIENILGFFPNITEIMKGYYLLVMPPGEIYIRLIDSVATRLGWRLAKSLEGEILEGYLLKMPHYLNLTIFLGETMIQSNIIFSLDSIRTIQAIGLGKKVVQIDRDHPQEIFSILNNLQDIFESTRSWQNRFGKPGAKEKIASYLLWGVVEDQKYMG